MAHIHIKPNWQLPERAATPEHVYLNRRQILAAMGIGAIGATGLSGLLARTAAAATEPTDVQQTLQGLRKLNAPRDPQFPLPKGRTLTPEKVAAEYNNFYEFGTYKDIWAKAAALTTEPWSLEVSGLVDHPHTYDVDELLRTMPLQERIYRHRCVEAWSMVVPWVGFPLRELIKKAGPKSGAKFVRMTTFMRPSEAPEQKPGGWFGSREPWPYTEGLTLAEATNELALMGVGIYGHVLPNQHGAPIRLIVPWKYGFKSIKSIVKLELVADEPATFWHTMVPNEYGFQSNVNPKIPHPRWSQAFEKDIGTRERVPTLLYNGYGDYVAGLYPPA
ncbi:MAG TPA: protein-methionine-sulfoxide reductase catalytic subunit MsrP [bacterium]|nr:protein-methionine-sulfoxide reductase catalytic subunit MsrP [bacterium]